LTSGSIDFTTVIPFVEPIDNSMQLYLYTSASFPGFVKRWFTKPSIKHNGRVIPRYLKHNGRVIFETQSKSMKFGT